MSQFNINAGIIKTAGSLTDRDLDRMETIYRPVKTASISENDILNCANIVGRCVKTAAKGGVNPANIDNMINFLKNIGTKVDKSVGHIKSQQNYKNMLRNAGPDSILNQRKGFLEGIKNFFTGSRQDKLNNIANYARLAEEEGYGSELASIISGRGGNLRGFHGLTPEAVNARRIALRLADKGVMFDSTAEQFINDYNSMINNFRRGIDMNPVDSQKLNQINAQLSALGMTPLTPGASGMSPADAKSWASGLGQMKAQNNKLTKRNQKLETDLAGTKAKRQAAEAEVKRLNKAERDRITAEKDQKIKDLENRYWFESPMGAATAGAGAVGLGLVGSQMLRNARDDDRRRISIF